MLSEAVMKVWAKGPGLSRAWTLTVGTGRRKSVDAQAGVGGAGTTALGEIQGASED